MGEAHGHLEEAALGLLPLPALSLLSLFPTHPKPPTSQPGIQAPTCHGRGSTSAPAGPPASASPHPPRLPCSPALLPNRPVVLRPLRVLIL